MAQYFTDFTDIAVGVIPSDSPSFPMRWGTMSREIVNSTEFGKKCLVYDGGESYSRHATEWAAPVSSPDQSVATTIWADWITADTTREPIAMVVLRGSGTTDTRTGYSLWVREYNDISLGVMVNGSRTILGSVHKQLTGLSKKVNVEFSVVGDLLECRVWRVEDARPETPDISANDSQVTSGWVGFGALGENPNSDITFSTFGVGTEGDVAPTSGAVAFRGDIAVVNESSGILFGDSPLYGEQYDHGTSLGLLGRSQGVSAGLLADIGPRANTLQGQTLNTQTGMSVGFEASLLNGRVSLEQSLLGLTAGVRGDILQGEVLGIGSGLNVSVGFAEALSVAIQKGQVSVEHSTLGIASGVGARVRTYPSVISYNELTLTTGVNGDIAAGTVDFGGVVAAISAGYKVEVVSGSLAVSGEIADVMVKDVVPFMGAVSPLSLDLTGNSNSLTTGNILEVTSGTIQFVGQLHSVVLVDIVTPTWRTIRIPETNRTVSIPDGVSTVRIPLNSRTIRITSTSNTLKVK